MENLLNASLAIWRLKEFENRMASDKINDYETCDLLADRRSTISNLMSSRFLSKNISTFNTKSKAKLSAMP